MYKLTLASYDKEQNGSLSKNKKFSHARSVVQGIARSTTFVHQSEIPW